MRKILLLIVCVLAFLPVLVAQTGLGVGGGPNYSQVLFSNRQGVPQGLAQGMEAGVVARFMNNRNLGLELQANLSQQGWLLFPDTTARHHKEFTSIQVPVLSYLELGKGTLRFTIKAGAFAGYIFQSRDVQVPSPEVAFRGPAAYKEQKELPWQYGVMGAAGPALAFPFGIIHLEVRFMQHLSDVLQADFNRDDYFASTRLQTLTFGLQWVYIFGKEQEK